VQPDPDRSPGSPPGEPEPFPDPRPFRRIQAATALLIAVAAAVTLLSDERPAAVRWSAVAGMAVLILVVWWITRHRRPVRERDPGEKSENAGDM
jgi:hypothetical protein